MKRARRTAAAEQDFENIAFQNAVEAGRPQTAELVLRGLLQRCDQMAEHSHIAIEGTSAPLIGAGVRLISHKRWVILFRYDGEGVMVLRIADGNQDYLSWKLS